MLSTDESSYLAQFRGIPVGIGWVVTQTQAIDVPENISISPNLRSGK